VRELRNEVRRAFAVAEEGKEITVALLSEHLRGPLGGDGDRIEGSSLKACVEALERQMIGDALEASSGNITRAATHLGLSRNGLQKKMTRYGLRGGVR
jgi:transcriptional regulator with PAS, ATPase and Fis domain